VIQDLDGATPEPTRRGHVVALSAAIAAVSLVLLVALVVPPSIPSTSPQAPAPSASGGPVMTIASGPTMFLLSNTPSQLRVDLTREILCADRARLNPPYHLAFDLRTGAIVAGRFDDDETRRPVSVTLVFDGGSGWLTVSCATSNVFAPRIDRAR